MKDTMSNDNLGSFQFAPSPQPLNPMQSERMPARTHKRRDSLTQNKFSSDFNDLERMLNDSDIQVKNETPHRHQAQVLRQTAQRHGRVVGAESLFNLDFSSLQGAPSNRNALASSDGKRQGRTSQKSARLRKTGWVRPRSLKKGVVTIEINDRVSNNIGSMEI